MRRTRLVSIAALIAAGSISLAACGSSSGGNNNTSAPAGSSPASTSVDSSTSASTSDSGSGSASSGGTVACAKGTLDAAGSTAQTNAMDAWRTAYQEKCSGSTVNYTPTSSGDGVTAFNNGTIQLAGSDSALDPSKGEVAAAQKQCGSTPLDLPMVVGPIAIAYKLSGVDKLVLNGPTIAEIFLGKITTWNDAAIKKLNPDANLPSTKISPFYRSDSSGTTKNFETYLAATAPKIFTTTPDKDSSLAKFAGQGVAKSQGVASSVSSTNGSIGYVEYSFAAGASLSTAEIDNGGGAVAVSPQTASAAAGTAKVVGTGNDLSLKIDYAQKAAGAYPLILVTYEVVCTKYKSAATGTLVKSFLSYTSGDGQSLLPGKGYAPIPSALLAKVKTAVATIS